MQLVKVLSSSYDQAKKRLIKLTRFGKSDTQTAMEAMPHGYDANPAPGLIAVYAETSEKGKEVIVGYLTKNQLANTGEVRIFSTDSTNNLRNYIWLKDNSIILFGGDEFGGLVRVPNLTIELHKIQDDIKALKDALTAWTPVSGDGGAALKTAITTYASNPLTRTNRNDIENPLIKHG